MYRLLLHIFSTGMDAFQGPRGPQGILDPSLTRQKQVERQEAPFRPTQFPPEEFRPVRVLMILPATYYTNWLVARKPCT